MGISKRQTSSITSLFTLYHAYHYRRLKKTTTNGHAINSHESGCGPRTEIVVEIRLDNTGELVGSPIVFRSSQKEFISEGTMTGQVTFPLTFELGVGLFQLSTHLNLLPTSCKRSRILVWDEFVEELPQSLQREVQTDDLFDFGNAGYKKKKRGGFFKKKKKKKKKKKS